MESDKAVSMHISSIFNRLKAAKTAAEIVKRDVEEIISDINEVQKGSLYRAFVEYNRKFKESRDCDTKDEADCNSLPCSSNPKKRKYEFTEHDDYVVVYTDGACESNGRANAKAGCGVWFGDSHPLNHSAPVNGKATNNVAEIQACTSALEIAHKEGLRKLKIMTDSQFTINCITKWMQKWKENNWTLYNGGPVKNKEELIKLDKMQELFTNVKWEYVAAHKGHHGNEEADRLARLGAAKYV